MDLRKATREDLVAIGRIADAAAWEAYSGLLEPATISGLVQRDFSPGSLKRRLLSGGVVVAEVSGRLVGFADAALREGHIRLSALSTDPAYRGAGIAAALLGEVRNLDPSLPICADALLGNLEVEHFYEAQGFVPGEILHDVVFDEPVVERRWWLSAR